MSTPIIVLHNYGWIFVSLFCTSRWYLIPTWKLLRCKNLSNPHVYLIKIDSLGVNSKLSVLGQSLGEWMISYSHRIGGVTRKRCNKVKFGPYIISLSHMPASLSSFIFFDIKWSSIWPSPEAVIIPLDFQSPKLWVNVLHYFIITWSQTFCQNKRKQTNIKIFHKCLKCFKDFSKLSTFTYSMNFYRKRMR